MTAAKNPNPLRIGVLGSKTEYGTNYMPEKVSFDSTPRYVNAATVKEPLCLSHEWRGSANRPGALDFMRCKSVGCGC